MGLFPSNCSQEEGIELFVFCYSTAFVAVVLFLSLFVPGDLDVVGCFLVAVRFLQGLLR